MVVEVRGGAGGGAVDSGGAVAVTGGGDGGPGGGKVFGGGTTFGEVTLSTSLEQTTVTNFVPVKVGGGAVDSAHSIQGTVAVTGGRDGEVVLHGIVIVVGGEGGATEELVINGSVTVKVVADEFNCRGYTSRYPARAFANAPKLKARTMLRLSFIIFK